MSILEHFTFPETCSTRAKLVFTASRTAFSNIFRCLIPFVVMMWEQLVLAWLSLYMLIGADINSSFKSISSRILAMRCRILTHSSVAYISESVELRSVMDWRFEIQWRGPFSHRMYPDPDRELNRSRCSGGMDGSGSDTFWEP